MTKGTQGNKNSCVYKKNMDHVSLSSATGLCPEGTAIETKQDCKAAYDWFKAMDTGCPTGAPNGGNCALNPNMNKANALAPASFSEVTVQKDWTDWPHGCWWQTSHWNSGRNKRLY